MNLYNLHDNPKSLDHHDRAHEVVPHLVAKRLLSAKYGSIDITPYEKILAKDPSEAFKVACFHEHRIPAIEPWIAKDARNSLQYATEVIGGAWPPGEPALAEELTYIIRYIREVLQGERFPLAEKAIEAKGDANWARVYAEEIDQRLPPKLEKLALSVPREAAKYRALMAERNIDLS